MRLEPSNDNSYYDSVHEYLQEHRHNRFSASSTSYTGLLQLDEETLLLSYDRLAHGWAGPPGRLGDSDYVFSMRVTVKPAG